MEQSLNKYERNNKLLSRVGYNYLSLSPCHSPCPGQGSSTPHLSVEPTGSVPALEAITSHRGDQALGLWLHSHTNPGLFLLPGPHLCLTAFLFFPRAIPDLQPEPLLAGCAVLPAMLATALSPLHSSCLVIPDSLACSDADPLLTSSLLLGFAQMPWLWTELHLLKG